MKLAASLNPLLSFIFMILSLNNSSTQTKLTNSLLIVIFSCTFLCTSRCVWIVHAFLILKAGMGTIFSCWYIQNVQIWINSNFFSIFVNIAKFRVYASITVKSQVVWIRSWRVVSYCDVRFFWIVVYFEFCDVIPGKIQIFFIDNSIWLWFLVEYNMIWFKSNVIMKYWKTLDNGSSFGFEILMIKFHYAKI